MAVVIRQLSAATPWLPQGLLRATVAWECNLDPMVELAQAKPKPICTAQAPPVGHMKWLMDTKNASWSQGFEIENLINQPKDKKSNP